MTKILGLQQTCLTMHLNAGSDYGIGHVVGSGSEVGWQYQTVIKFLKYSLLQSPLKSKIFCGCMKDGHVCLYTIVIER